MQRPIPSLDAVRAEIAERSLRDFIRLGWRYIDPAPFVSNWHIDAICEHLEAVNRGKSRRLLINVPPRHMKSIAVSVAWPAWTWAQSARAPLMGPQVQWMYASYAHTLSIRDSTKCRRLIDSPFYQKNWGSRFRLTSDQNSKVRFDNDQQGYRLSTSVDGSLTGEGAGIIVIDDPHNVREAESEAVREGTLAWWDEAMSTRLNDPKTGAYVVIMQRVHERDLSGHILAKSHGWDHLCLPARYEPDHPFVYVRDPRKEAGELLWPERMGEDEVTTLETSLGSYGAAGQLQQRPAPRDGGMFKRGWFKPIGAVPADAQRIRAWDLAATEVSGRSDPDWTVGLKMAKDRQGFYYIEDVIRFRGSPAEVERTILATAALDGSRVAITIPQDPGQAGKSQAQYFVRQLAGYNVSTSPETGEKSVRATPLAAQAEAGNVFIVTSAWNQAFISEAEVFPNGAHDDQIDAASRAFVALANVGTSSVAPLRL